MIRRFVVVLSFLVGIGCASGRAADFTQAEGDAALRKAVEFFRTQIAVEGGYVYQTSDDLMRREGEDKVTPTQVWIQPPATPAVGEAYLEAWRWTGDQYLLDAARETAECLIRGQLRSGGWFGLIEFDPQERVKNFDFRVDPPSAELKKRRTTTLDDDKSQSCVRFMMRLDEATGFKDARLHEATIYALESLLKAQYPNGAWPQQFSEPPNPADFPVAKASYPESWSRTFPSVNYSRFYTFNDDTIADVVALMIEAADTYKERRYLAAAERAGDFIIAAQMPEPQPAWAQQYDVDMHPVWARKFEPPAITGSESQGVIKILFELYRATGNEKYLKPIPPALAWLKRSVLPEGGLARFYELHTNKPLYFTKQYELTYDDSDLPTHYGFKVGSGNLERMQADYEKLAAEGPPAKKARKHPETKLTPALAAEAEKLVQTMDDRGAWVVDGKLRSHGEEDPTTRVITSQTFIKNMIALARFVGAK